MQAMMIDSIDPKVIDRPEVRCDECDRMVTNYNVFFSATNEQRNVCWECLSRREKNFNAKRNFRRGSRFGFIPR